ncbi:radical SAM protein [Heliobacterium chlorum]|uniref:Radical SAM protein n=1 Tax=Heliobacterium chlorum TaxID=2698 RepID=A0ABR7T4V3_HELCL|nr:radical SAM protein [Heliobacterium chlorum]MBC9785810.1 radical SAM protein [Heliobacterium chlorum]
MRIQIEELRDRARQAHRLWEACILCGRRCQINRRERAGLCRAGNQAVVASYGPHWGEERPLVGTGGSGTIFFSYCNLSCVFCQNFDISHEAEGEEVDGARLGAIILSLQKQGCENINLVSPTHYVPVILDGLTQAAEKGLHVPIVYNSGGYDSLEILQLLDGIIDIYLPDFKFASDDLGQRFCGVKDYASVAKAALKEMYRQVGLPQLDEEGTAQKGLIIRHLMMPALPDNTLDAIRFIVDEVSPQSWVNVMAQYYPAYRAEEHPPIDKPLSRREYLQVIKQIKLLGPELKLLNGL